MNLVESYSMATSGKHKHPKLEKNMLQLCDLPDDILIRILWLLPLKSAVATSALSRRWQFLWASFPYLEINQDMFSYRTEFFNFMDRAMVLRDGSSLVSFSLKCELLSDAARINSWITSSIQCNVKELLLDLQCIYPSYLMPSCIFGSPSLLKIDLKVPNYILRVPSSICLSNLKCLRLCYVTFLDEKSTEKLLSLPMLEELVIGWCGWRNVKAVRISAPKLQILEIHEYGYSREDDFVVESKVWIFSDSIRSFLYEGMPFNEFRICGSTVQLSKAQILVNWECLLDRSYMGGAANRCYKLVNGLSWVQDLTLTEDLLMLLEHIPELADTIPVFECLTRLNVDDLNWVCIDSWMLMEIYKRCPLLEHLNIMKDITRRSIGSQMTPTPSCFRTHLKKIQILSYALDEDEYIDVYAIDILLKSAFVLEEMIICLAAFDGVEFDDEHVSTVITELGDMLNRRPRASKDCKISVVLDLP